MATFEDLTIERMIVHEVVLASALNGPDAPLMSTALSQLDPAGLRLVSRRVAEALGTDSHSVEVEVAEAGDGSAFQMCSSLLDAAAPEFIATSQRLATKLSRSQNVGSIKGGIALIFQGSAGPATQRQRLIVVVKAESDSAFIKTNNPTGVLLQFVREMVFGAQQRLFKVGAFIEVRRRPGTPRAKSDFETVVYDHQMNIKGAGQAAQYFYATFLGTTMAPSAPQLSKQFFDATTKFINESNRTRAERWELRNHLVSYLRSNEPTISGKIFSDRFLRADERQAYLGLLREEGLPGRAIPKDNRFIDSQLKLRKLTFSNRIQLSGPSDAFANSITVEEGENSTTIRIAATVVDDR